MLRHEIDVDGRFKQAPETQTDQADLGQIIPQI